MDRFHPVRMQASREGDFRLGSLADIVQCPRHVRFTPESRHSSVRVGCPKSATNGRRLEWRREGIRQLKSAIAFSARDIDGGKRRLIGDLGTSNHDLSDLARKLINGRRKDEAENAAPDNRSPEV